ncbi:MAG: hypothetical protein ACT4RN_21230, partial [Pseudonocardia sp.]
MTDPRPAPWASTGLPAAPGPRTLVALTVGNVAVIAGLAVLGVLLVVEWQQAGGLVTDPVLRVLRLVTGAVATTGLVACLIDRAVAVQRLRGDLRRVAQPP